VIDSNAVNSTLSATKARIAFDLTADSPGSVPLGTVDGDPEHKRFGHVFSSLDFGGVAVANPHVAIIPDLVGAKDPNNGFTTGSRVQRVDDGLASDLTVGMDVLKHLHIYIAFDERKLYISAADTPAATTAAATQAPAAPQ